METENNPQVPQNAPEPDSSKAASIGAKLIVVVMIIIAAVCGITYKSNYDKQKEAAEQAKKPKVETKEERAKREAEEKRKDSLAKQMVIDDMIKDGASEEMINYTKKYYGMPVDETSSKKSSGKASSGKVAEMPAAYNEGHDTGYSSGLEDGQYGRSRLANFDDHTRYKGKNAKNYKTGYREGYESGYEDGRAEYEAQHSSY